MFRVIKYFILGIFILLLTDLILQFGINSKYSFPEPHQFRGSFIYNPYKNIDTAKWIIANFHAHSHKLFENSETQNKKIRELDSLYKYFGYRIFSISDYQSINLHEENYKWFVPVYEHGFQYYKNHSLVFNAKKVNWDDYSFRQTLSNKQFIIDQLKKDPGVLVAIVHPIYRNAYSPEDFKYLANYNCLEIANHNHLFTSCYDTILSSGHPVFVLADDDAHDFSNPKEVCSSYNLVNTSLVKDSVLKALTAGRLIAVKLNIDSFKTNAEKKSAMRELPKIISITLINDTVDIRLNKKADVIRFVGQDGREKMKISGSSEAAYYFNKKDTYIRAEIVCNNGTIYFLNPFFRYNGMILTDYMPVKSILKTWISRTTIFGILMIILIIRFSKSNV
jgi:hypothetical protein